MNEELLVGLLALAVPLFGVGFLMLRRQAGIFRMFVAMLLIGLGYLAATGALGDIGRKVLGRGDGSLPAPMPAKTGAAPPPAAAPVTPPAATPSAATPSTPPPAATPPPPAATPTQPAPAR
jgi:hypothetical protein